MAAEIPAQTKLGNRDAGALGRPLDRDVPGARVLALERLGRRELGPFLIADAVLPEGAGTGFDIGLVGEQTAVQVQVVVVVPEVAVCDSWWAGGLGKPAKGWGADVPGFGEVEGEKVIV